MKTKKLISDLKKVEQLEGGDLRVVVDVVNHKELGRLNVSLVSIVSMEIDEEGNKELVAILECK